MKLALHVADENGMINLAGVVPPGTHYTVARNENTGVVRLTPVEVNTTAKRQQTPADDDDVIMVGFGNDDDPQH